MRIKTTLRQKVIAATPWFNALYLYFIFWIMMLQNWPKMRTNELSKAEFFLFAAFLETMNWRNNEFYKTIIWRKKAFALLKLPMQAMAIPLKSFWKWNRRKVNYSGKFNSTQNHHVNFLSVSKVKCLIF